MSFIRVFTGTCVVAGVVTAVYYQPRSAMADDHAAHMMPADLSAPRIVNNLTEQGLPGLPASANNAAARLKASNRHAEWVKVPWEPGSKDSLMAWIVYPATSNAKTPVVVVVHEIYGLSTWVRGVADQAAADGFIAIAPDLMSRARGGPSADEITSDSASKLQRMVSSAEKNNGIASVAKYAMSQVSAAPRYAVIGYCWGGAAVWGHATNGGIAGYVGGVAYYGTPYMNGQVPNADSLKKITTPVMMFGGTTDARITAAMPATDSMMKAFGKNYSAKNYEGAAHGFLRAQDDAPGAGGAANLAATKDAWPKTVEFLKKNLAAK